MAHSGWGSLPRKATNGASSHGAMVIFALSLMRPTKLMSYRLLSGQMATVSSPYQPGLCLDQRQRVQSFSSPLERSHHDPFTVWSPFSFLPTSASLLPLPGLSPLLQVATAFPCHLLWVFSLGPFSGRAGTV